MDPGDSGSSPGGAQTNGRDTGGVGPREMQFTKGEEGAVQRSTNGVAEAQMEQWRDSP